MRKKLMVSFLLSLVINAVLMGVNYISYQNTKYLKYAFDVHGGEITIQYASGLRATHIYGMTADAGTTHSLNISWISLITYMFICTVVIFLILYLIQSIRNSKQKEIK